MKTKTIELAAKNPSTNERKVLEIEISQESAKILVHSSIHGKTSHIESVFEVSNENINFLIMQVRNFFENEHSND